MDTTGTVVSTRRSRRRSGERIRATIRPMMMGTRACHDHLLGEELAKETEEDRIRHPEEEEISPARHPDRQVSLMG